MGMSFPAMPRDGGRRLVQRNVALWIAKIEAGWLGETRRSAIPDTLASVARKVELVDMTAIKGRLEINNSKEQK